MTSGKNNDDLYLLKRKKNLTFNLIKYVERVTALPTARSINHTFGKPLDIFEIKKADRQKVHILT
jgi:hypothetical protein